MKIKPSFSEFKKMSQQGNLVPVFQEFLADTETPVSAYLKLRNGANSYLLESADGGKRWGRYSFIGCNPFIRVFSRDGRMEICNGDNREVLENVSNPMEVLRDLIAKFKPVTTDDLPAFQGGLVGFVNYDLVRTWERLPGISPINRSLPEAIFSACRNLIIFDHFTHMIKVPRLMEIERYSHVMHIVSRVEGILKQDKDCFDLFMSSFPAGTVSGAPKIKAMQIISELETSPRGPYAGAVGYFGFNGNMDFCITIRTMAIILNKLSIQVGAGIVADSCPENEYEETLRKAGAMFKAIERIKDNDSADR